MPTLNKTEHKEIKQKVKESLILCGDAQNKEDDEHYVRPIDAIEQIAALLARVEELLD